MEKNEIKDLTLASVFAAIILLMTFVPQIGYITIGTVALTLIHIPVLIGVFLLPKKYSLVLALFFGLGSLIRAATTPTGPLDPAFVNPLVSVLPRLLFALAAIYIVELFKVIEVKVKNSDIYIFGLVTLITSLGIYYAGQAIIGFTAWNSTLITILFLVINVGFIMGYYAFIKKSDHDKILIPSTLILATFIHTVLVLTALVVFERALVTTLIPSDQLFGLIVSIAVTNGLVEAILAAFIGTPILLALQKVKEKQ
ncbi:MAG: ECF transporter S component [Acholeplasmataceae bacterium]|nr:ECF transporter S component [Acholeplasmataceae bacterium]